MILAFRILNAHSSDDIAAVRSLFEAYQASLDVDLCFQDFATELAGLPGKYAPPGGALLIARGEDGTPLGCVALRPLDEAGAGEIKRLYVAPAARGSGLGRGLVEAVIAEARRIGLTDLYLDTLPSMAAAQALYRAKGFEEIAAYYETPVVGTLFLRLRLR